MQGLRPRVGAARTVAWPDRGRGRHWQRRLDVAGPVLPAEQALLSEFVAGLAEGAAVDNRPGGWEEPGPDVALAALDASLAESLRSNLVSLLQGTSVALREIRPA